MAFLNGLNPRRPNALFASSSNFTVFVSDSNEKSYGAVVDCESEVVVVVDFWFNVSSLSSLQ